MKDYMPIIGEINGNVDIIGQDTNISFKKIKAFYTNNNNIFNLMIEE